MMDWVNIIVSILSGLATAIPLVITLVRWIKKAIQEKNWKALIDLVTKLMQDAEQKFNNGAERKDYVMLAIKASADTINYKIDMSVVSELIDSLTSMSKVVNVPKEEVAVEAGS